jgi:hypothetical protein
MVKIKTANKASVQSTTSKSTEVSFKEMESTKKVLTAVGDVIGHIVVKYLKVISGG